VREQKSRLAERLRTRTKKSKTGKTELTGKVVEMSRGEVRAEIKTGQASLERRQGCDQGKILKSRLKKKMRTTSSTKRDGDGRQNVAVVREKLYRTKASAKR